jgi:hypothetical protein
MNRLSRRQLQIGLGVLWLVDGVLQLQPFMFGAGFARDVLAPAGHGQPGWVAGPVAFFAAHISAHPVVFNTAFALGQLALGVGLLLPRTVRPAILASTAWSLSVWWLGEGLGGLASGHASLITGAPGAVVLYAVLGVAAWPPRAGIPGRNPARHPPARWLTWVWALLWLGGAALQLLPAQNSASTIADQLASGASDAPRWLAATDRLAAHTIAHAGPAGVVALTAVMAAVGLGALRRGRARTAAVLGGGVFAVLLWLIGQNLGALYTGQATDPNTGPLLVLFALAVFASTPAAVRKPQTTPLHHPPPHPPVPGRPTCRPIATPAAHR